AARVVRQLVEPAEEPDPHALGLQLGRLAPDRVLEQREQATDLVVGSGPVLPAERVDGDDGNAPPDGVPEEGPDRLDARRVSFDLGQPALPRPAAVALHDDPHGARALCGTPTRTVR